MSLIQSCKNCDVNPWEYFDDMLRRIMSHPVSRLRERLPDQWNLSMAAGSISHLERSSKMASSYAYLSIKKYALTE